MKLQQAYISEAVAIGDWQIIGYKGPGDSKNATSSETNNFKYSDGGTTPFQMFAWGIVGFIGGMLRNTIFFKKIQSKTIRNISN